MPSDEAESLVARRRRQVVAYVLVVFALSFALQIWMIRSAGGLAALGGLAVLVLMWIPGLISIAARWLSGDGFGDAGFRPGPWRYWAIAYLAPLGFAVFTYGVALAAGIVVFEPRPSALGYESPVVRWLVGAVLVNLTLGVFIANIPSLGEELGWRGYLLTRLVEAKVPAPLWVSGLIWGAWHLPLILWGDYATSSRPWLSALLFMIVVTLAGVFFGWLRLAGGSVWPAMLAHSSHNVAYQSMFDAHMNGPLERTFAGEQGLFSIVAYGAAVAWLWRSGRLARVLERPVLAARPKDEPPATLPSAGEAPWQRES